eukprot:TRINITY_DN32491_c0_g1_i1.p2 TRINITY_DN32491_c0_g1~~TRINITY_DN32491_c0_g1_i1.p2  ORF type:complete len:106 (+),score=42.16 TRINITY_DN32491_c0_g1_i1:183-500(+)
MCIRDSINAEYGGGLLSPLMDEQEENLDIAEVQFHTAMSGRADSTKALIWCHPMASSMENEQRERLWNSWDHEVAQSYLSLIHISDPTRLLSISYAVFCLKKKNT